MPLVTGQSVTGLPNRTYSIQVPDNPSTATVPAVVVFHGGGQDATTIAARWGVDPPNPVPAELADYLLIFPESDPRLGAEWVHFQAGDSAFPTLDLDFVRLLIAEVTARQYETATAGGTVTADAGLLYAAGFSNGGGMVWQLMNSALGKDFRGFAAVGKALDPEKARHYRNELAAVGAAIEPAPVAYIQGTADRGYRPSFTLDEIDVGMTLPAFTCTEMLDRNGVPPGTAAHSELVPGSTGVTEVLVQLFEGAAAFLMATIINGGHNWPMPTTVGNPPVATHFDATETIVRFWRQHAGLPG
jgi:poly(3-hydroxybutyrate) depolymerase